MADLVVPEVRTLAKPLGSHLVAARFLVQHLPELQAAFQKYREQGANATQALADEIEPILADNLDVPDLTVFQVSEVAEYLADEYFQIGDAVLVIDRETGKAVAKITDEDMWQPAMVPRESGAMAQPLAQLRPELQGYLVRWAFERDREKRLVGEITDRLVQTDSDRESGDRRLLATTAGGRGTIVEELGAKLPDLIPGAVGGSLRKFIDLFTVTTAPDGGMFSSTVYKAFAKVTVGIMDGKARNPLFDIPVSHRANIALQWAREIARTATEFAHGLDANVSSVEAVEAGGVWIAPADEALALQRASDGVFAIPVEGSKATLFVGYAGHLVLGRTEIAAREIHDRWEIGATLTYSMELDISNVVPTTFTDMPIPEVRAEIVR